METAYFNHSTEAESIRSRVIDSDPVIFLGWHTPEEVQAWAEFFRLQDGLLTDAEGEAVAAGLWENPVPRP